MIYCNKHKAKELLELVAIRSWSLSRHFTTNVMAPQLVVAVSYFGFSLALIRRSRQEGPTPKRVRAVSKDVNESQIETTRVWPMWLGSILALL
jgi:hypothetical protein